MSVYVLTAKYYDNSGFKVLCVHETETDAKRDQALIEAAGTDQVVEIHEVEYVGNF